MLEAIDLEDGTGFSQKSCPALKELIHVKALKDISRVKNPGSKEFTFYRPGSTPSRLDRFYISEGSMGKVGPVMHVASLSDHMGILVSLQMDIVKLPKRKISGSYWKLNSVILKEDEFLPNF